MNNNKLIAGVVIVAVIVILLVVVGGRSDDTAMNSVSPTTSPLASVSGSPMASATPVGATKTPGAATLSYQQALAKYGGNRIQFTDTCQASPAALSVKNGTGIMLDNRSKTARTVSVGTVKYYMAGYGFRIIAPTSSTLPKDLLIDCGTSQNVAKISLQK